MRFRCLPELAAALVALGLGRRCTRPPSGSISPGRRGLDDGFRCPRAQIGANVHRARRVCPGQGGPVHARRDNSRPAGRDVRGRRRSAGRGHGRRPAPDLRGCVDGPPNGFLATAAALSALRAGRFVGHRRAGLVCRAAGGLRPARGPTARPRRTRRAGSLFRPRSAARCWRTAACLISSSAAPTLDEGTLRLTIPPPAIQVIGE